MAKRKNGKKEERIADLLRWLDERWQEDRGITEDEILQRYGISHESWKDMRESIHARLKPTGHILRTDRTSREIRLVHKGSGQHVRYEDLSLGKAGMWGEDLSFQAQKLAVLRLLMELKAQGVDEVSRGELCRTMMEQNELMTDASHMKSRLEHWRRLVTRALDGRTGLAEDDSADPPAGQGLLAEGCVTEKKDSVSGVISLTEEASLLYFWNYDFAYDLLMTLENARKTSHAVKTLENIRDKLVTVLDLEETLPDSWETGMRTHRSTDMNRVIRKLEELLARKKVLRYRLKEEPKDAWREICVGAAVYDEYTECLYLLGRTVAAPEGKPDVLQDMTQVDWNSLACTEADSSEYGKPIYRDLLNESIHLSLEEAVETEVWIDLSENRNRDAKLKHLQALRPQMQMTMTEKDGRHFVIVRDHVRGLNDYANLLLQFTESVSVKAPQALREAFRKEAERTLRRYGMDAEEQQTDTVKRRENV